MEVLREWHEFYILLGTAGATLVGLLFVAVSIGAGYLTRERAAATRTYTSPVVLHFSAILFVSLLALAPAHPPVLIAALIAAAAIAGICVSGFVTFKVARDRHDEVIFTDTLAYGAFPVLGYAAMLAATIIPWHSPEVLASGLLILLLANIRNAWDLMLLLVRRHSHPGPS